MRTLAEDVIPPPIAALSIRDSKRHPTYGTTRPIKVSRLVPGTKSPPGGRIWGQNERKAEAMKLSFHTGTGMPDPEKRDGVLTFG